MASQNTTVRSLHDLGIATWFGGALMGAVGLNGASGDVLDPRDRTRVASAGWARWSPVASAAIGAHLLGGLGLLVANRGRVAVEPGARSNTLIKTGLTLAALGTTAYSGLLGRRMAAAGSVPAESATVPAATTPGDVATIQQRQRVLQWMTPALTGIVIALGAQQGEQQRPGSRMSRGAEALRSRFRHAAA